MEEFVEQRRLLKEAISEWRPDRPRRWLYRYGGINSKGEGEYNKKYRDLHRLALKSLRRASSSASGGLPSHILWLD